MKKWRNTILLTVACAFLAVTARTWTPKLLPLLGIVFNNSKALGILKDFVQTLVALVTLAIPLFKAASSKKEKEGKRINTAQDSGDDSHTARNINTAGRDVRIGGTHAEHDVIIYQNAAPSATIAAAPPSPHLVITENSISITESLPASFNDAQPVILWRELPPPNAIDVFRILDWRTRATPLVGREDDQQRLLDWAGAGAGILVRFLVGPGGAGKTRLALETADVLRKDGWTAGQIFLDRSGAVPIAGRGLFLVVDYPEACRPQVRVLLRDLARVERIPVPIRILMLSRSPLKEWQSLIDTANATSICDAVDLPIGMLPAAAGVKLFGDACRRFAVYSKQTVPPIPESAVAEWLGRSDTQSLPLFIVAAALHCTLNHTGELSLTGAQIVEGLVRRERLRLDKAGQSAKWGESTASRLVGLAAVSDGLDSAAIKRLAAQPEIGLPTERPVDAIKSLGFWNEDRVPPPTPDIVAAELLFQVLEASPDESAEWLWASLADSAPRKVDGLSRIAYDIATLRGKEGFDRFSTRLAASIADLPDRASQWRAIFEEERTPPGLFRLAVAIGKALLKKPTISEIERASILTTLSERLSDSGDVSGAAVRSSQEAVGIWRRLNQGAPEIHEPDLARSLSALALCLRNDQKAADGIAPGQEAVGIWRRLSETGSGLNDADRARSLLVWSICLSEGGKPTEAIEPARQAVEIWRNLATLDPKRYEPELARALSVLSVDLSDSNEKQASLETIRGAVEIWQRLAAEFPGRYEPDLALGLQNLWRSLKDAGESGAALVAIQGAIKMYRAYVVAANPARYEPRLAQSLENLYQDLRETGDPLASVNALRDSVNIKLRLATSDPSRYEPGLADRLSRLSRDLGGAEDVAHASALLDTFRIAESTVCVLLVRGENPDGDPIYAYVAVRANKLEAFMEAQKHGMFYPEDFGVIVESGEGQPSEEVRKKMQVEYGFNHEAMVDIPDPEGAYRIQKSLKPPVDLPDST